MPQGHWEKPFSTSDPHTGGLAQNLGRDEEYQRVTWRGQGGQGLMESNLVRTHGC